MKIGIYDPYLHILGGAEKYVFTIADCFGPAANVTVYAADPRVLTLAENKFGIKLPTARIAPWPESSRERDRELKDMDFFFYVTDGSIFRSVAKMNILIIQTPLHIPAYSLANWWKLRTWRHIICYSRFIANIIKGKLGRDAKVLFVPIKKIPPRDFLKKENTIVSVGRFFPHLHNKKQLEMVDMFARFVDIGIKGVKLYLVGSVDPGGEEYFEKVELKARNLPVWVESQMSYNQLAEIYKRAKVYWHATGYGENLEKFPERAEHFGVTTVEAMSHGVVPVVFGAGGQAEIVTNGQDGFTWKNEAELLKYTLMLLTNMALQERMAYSAFDSALQFTKDTFCERLHEILEIQ